MPCARGFLWGNELSSSTHLPSRCFSQNGQHVQRHPLRAVSSSGHLSRPCWPVVRCLVSSCHWSGLPWRSEPLSWLIFSSGGGRGLATSTALSSLLGVDTWQGVSELQGDCNLIPVLAAVD